MTPAARVQAAIEILDLVASDVAVEKALTGWGRRSRFAGSKDRAAVRDHVFSALRCKRSFGWLGGGETGRHLMFGALRAEGIDPSALFNGLGHGPEPLTDAELASAGDLSTAPQPVQLDVPDWLWPHLQQSLGDQTKSTLGMMRERAPVQLRANTIVKGRDALLQELVTAGYDAVALEMTPTGIEVAGAPRGLVSLPAFIEGAFEMQDGASQSIVDRLSGFVAGADVLDYCAGGGGKSLAMAAYTPRRLVAHDVDTRRMSHLPERAERAGAKVEIVGEVSGQFDLVLCDAPCSGSGAWRRQPAAKWDLTQSRLNELRSMQIDILRKARAFVRPGGHLAYATCSLLDHENDKTVDTFLLEASDWHSVVRLRLTPLDGGDGFYLNVMKEREPVKS
ncbi:MAG: RsmB/NOP family class I SAM-dependent RNA methyltransferase [Boseongicola sp.]|nr:RsmB/NOP family class I SAM-dependent RNA methyltransferase [Boseongicola sp.]